MFARRAGRRGRRRRPRRRHRRRAGSDGRRPSAPGEAAGRGAERPFLALAGTGLEADDVVRGDLERDPLLAVSALELARPEPALDEDAVALRRFSAVRSARSPQTVTRNQSVASTHSPVCWFFVLWFTATLNSVTGRPLGVYRISGSRPRLPMIMAFENDAISGPAQSMAAGAASLSDSSIRSWSSSSSSSSPDGMSASTSTSSASLPAAASRRALTGLTVRVTR